MNIRWAFNHDEATKLQEAEEKGKKEEKLENARNFLLIGASIEMVSGGTGLDIEVVKKLKKEIEGSNLVRH